MTLSSTLGLSVLVNCLGFQPRLISILAMWSREPGLKVIRLILVTGASFTSLRETGEEDRGHSTFRTASFFGTKVLLALVGLGSNHDPNFRMSAASICALFAISSERSFSADRTSKGTPLRSMA